MESLLKNQDTSQTDSHLFVADRTNESSTFQNTDSELDPGFHAEVNLRAFENSECAEPEIKNVLPVWDMVSLGVEEALPAPKVQDALWVYDSELFLEYTNNIPLQTSYIFRYGISHDPSIA